MTSTDFSPERRAATLSYLRSDSIGPRVAALDPQERIVLAVSLLVCDDAGFATEATVRRSLKDPSVMQAARTLLAEAGVL